jgi:signal transduction histidine kinase
MSSIFNKNNNLKDFELSLKLLDSTLTVISDISEINTELKIVDRLNQITNSIGKEMNVEFCTIGLFNENIKNEVVDLKPYFGFSLTHEQELIHTKFKKGDVDRTIVGHVLKERLDLFEWRAKEDGHLFNKESNTLNIKLKTFNLDKERTLQYDLHAFPNRIIHLLIVGMYKTEVSDKEPIGYIYLINKLSENKINDLGFSKIDIQTIKILAKQLALAIQTYQFYLKQDEDWNTIKKQYQLSNIDLVIENILKYLNKQFKSVVASLWIPVEDDNDVKVILKKIELEDVELRNELEKNPVFELKNNFIGRILNGEIGQEEVHYMEKIPDREDCWFKYAKRIGTTQVIAIPIPKSNLLETKYSSKNEKWKNVSAIICLRPESGSVITDFQKKRLQRFAKEFGFLIDELFYKKRYAQIEKLKERLSEFKLDDIKPFYDKLVSTVAEVIEAEACSIFFTGDDNKGLILKSTTAKEFYKRDPSFDKILDRYDAADYLNNQQKPVYVDEQSITVRVLNEDRTKIIYDVRDPKSKSSSNFLEVVESENHYSLLFSPIKVHDKPIGVLRCINKKKASNTLLHVFVLPDKEFLELIMGIVSKFIAYVELNNEKNRFLRRLAHENRGPVQGLQSIIELMQFKLRQLKVNTLSNEANYVLLETSIISNNYDNISYIVNQQFGLPNKYSFELKNMRQQIERMTEVIKPMGKYLFDHEIELVLKITHLPEMYIDSKMVQVFYNLIANAIKYSEKIKISGPEIINTPKPKIEIIYKGNVTIELNSTNLHCEELQITNLGIGINKGEEDKVFEEYFRSEKAKAKAPTGSGIGLTVSQDIVKNHGGIIRVKQNDNPTIFSIYLPSSLKNQKPSNS